MAGCIFGHKLSTTSVKGKNTFPQDWVNHNKVLFHVSKRISAFSTTTTTLDSVETRKSHFSFHCYFVTNPSFHVAEAISKLLVNNGKWNPTKLRKTVMKKFCCKSCCCCCGTCCRCRCCKGKVKVKMLNLFERLFDWINERGTEQYNFFVFADVFKFGCLSFR